LVVEQQDLGKFGEHRRQRRVRWCRFAELPSEIDVLLLCQMLLAEEHDLPLQQCRADLADRLGAQW
jgi:hypothetical protein